MFSQWRLEPVYNNNNKQSKQRQQKKKKKKEKRCAYRNKYNLARDFWFQFSIWRNTPENQKTQVTGQGYIFTYSTGMPKTRVKTRNIWATSLERKRPLELPSNQSFGAHVGPIAKPYIWLPGWFPLAIHRKTGSGETARKRRLMNFCCLRML